MYEFKFDSMNHKVVSHDVINEYLCNKTNGILFRVLKIVLVKLLKATQWIIECLQICVHLMGYLTDLDEPLGGFERFSILQYPKMANEKPRPF